MEITDSRIDAGKAFDWGRTSKEYARYRDISPEQIEQAKVLAGSAEMKIDFQAVPTEQLDFSGESFDVITACQCFWYFDHEKVIPLLARLLKPDGKLLILYMAWLPFEDTIARASEELVLKYRGD